MFLIETEKIKLQELSLPEGYCLVKEGDLQPGDIRWNPYDDSWNLLDVVCWPKHKCIIGDPVSNFHGICRKIDTEPVEDAIISMPMSNSLEYSIVEL